MIDFITGHWITGDWVTTLIFIYSAFQVYGSQSILLARRFLSGNIDWSMYRGGVCFSPSGLRISDNEITVNFAHF